MTGCFLCETSPADLHDAVKAYSKCDRLEGGPCHPCREYVELEGRIQDAKKILEDMVAQKHEIRARINHFHDPITRRFPTEIISIIFQHALPDKWTDFDELGQELVDKALIRGPLFLGAVCNAWRRIAWSTPRMWTIVQLVMKTTDDNYNRLDVLESWLNRTGKLPLSIRIAFWPSAGYEEDHHAEDMDLVDDLIDLVNKQSHRWNELEVQAPAWLFQGINEGIQKAHNLQTLRAAVTGDYSGSQGLLDSPHIRPMRVTLHSVDLEAFKIDWGHVTRLSASRFYSDECVEVLRCAIRLLHCEFLEVIDPSRPTFPLHDQPIIQFTLQTLWMFPSQTLVQRVILDSFIFPSLHSVELLGLDADSLPELISRSSCPITSLKIPAEGIAGDISLQAFLSKVPTLERLTLTSEGDTSTTEIVYPFLDQLAASSAPTPSLDQSVSDSDSNQIIVPNLTSLSLFGFSRTFEFWKRLSQIFGPVSDIRHPHRRPLKKLLVAWKVGCTPREKDYIDKELVLKFMELRDLGIVLNFGNESYKNDLLDLSIAHYALNIPSNSD